MRTTSKAARSIPTKNGIAASLFWKICFLLRLSRYLLPNKHRTEDRTEFLRSTAPFIRPLAHVVALVALSACVSTPPSPPLHQEIRNGSIDGLRKQIVQGNSLSERDRNGLTPLLLAVKLGRREIAIELIKSGAEINARSRTGATALSMAVEKGYTDVVDLLLQRKALIDFQATGDSPLFSAISAGDLEMFDRLVRHGAQTGRRNRQGQTPLHLASRLGHAAIVERLLDAGVDINAELPDHRTPLHSAVLNGKTAVATLLYARGASVGAATGEVGVFSTAIVYHFAAEKEAEKGEFKRASEYLQLAKAAFLSAHTLLDAQADAIGNQVLKTQLVNSLTLVLGAFAARTEAQTSPSGTGVAIVYQGETTSGSALRDKYRNAANRCAAEAERMDSIQKCMAGAGVAGASCFSNSSK